MKLKKQVSSGILIALLIVLLIGYGLAFIMTKRYSTLDTFDNIMSEDIAQIARNTIRGNFFVTKYILPVGYAHFPYTENHPDYIRYPFIILLYSFLFLVAPDSPATIKLFNGFLFLLNGFLIFCIAFSLLERNSDIKLSKDKKNWIAAFTAILASFAVENYFRYSLSDAYEVPTTTILLFLIISSSILKSPAWAGFAQAILYMCRPNMVVFLPFVWVYLILEKKSHKERLLTTTLFLGSFILTMTPLLIRNILVTGKLLFSLQQTIELLKDTVASHNDLYMNFSIPPSIFPITRTFLHQLFSKFKIEIIKPFMFSLKAEYLISWAGIFLFMRKFKRDRILLVTILLSLFAHIFIISFFLQLDRVYVPLFLIICIFGFLGILISARDLISKLVKKDLVLDQKALILSLVIISALCFAITHPKRPERDNRTRPPSLEAVTVLKDNKIECVYSNVPYWITWYADIVAIYEPDEFEDIYTKGPDYCRYFLSDERKPHPVSELAEDGLLIYKGEDFSLYSLEAHFDL